MLNHDKIILLLGCFTAWCYVKNLLLKDLANRVVLIYILSDNTWPAKLSFYSVSASVSVVISMKISVIKSFFDSFNNDKKITERIYYKTT